MTPSALGAASGPGEFAILFGAGVSVRWTGISRKEPAALGALIARNDSLVFSVLSGSPAGVVISRKFSLWDDQDTNNQRRCQLVAGRVGGQLLLYALAAQTEIVSYVAILEALVDRPALATGARIPAIFLSGNVGLLRNPSGHRLIVFSSTPNLEVAPGSPPAAFPMALDNALLDVSVPAAIFIDATTDASFNGAKGFALILFGYLLIELYLPDPYTRGFTPGQDRVLDIYGLLLAEIVWSKPSTVAMRLIDTGHAHPDGAANDGSRLELQSRMTSSSYPRRSPPCTRTFRRQRGSRLRKPSQNLRRLRRRRGRPLSRVLRRPF